jgi:hypothetical protein
LRPATPVELDVVFFYGSLVLSLAAVVLFLFLIRRPADPTDPPRPPEGSG